LTSGAVECEIDPTWDFHMSDKLQAWLILIGLIGTVTAAYLLAWRAKSGVARRGASSIISLVSFLVAFCATVYSFEVMKDILDPGVPLWALLIGFMMVAICIGAWTIAIKFALIAVRKSTTR
jgi:hypothetical protein